LTLVEGL
jgi:hypothetical protein